MTKFVFKNSKINISPSKYVYKIFKENNFTVKYIPNCINFLFIDSETQEN